MTVTINRLQAPYFFEAQNEQGNRLTMDAAPDIGGTGRGFRPMQTLLAGLGGCSAIDIVSILEKGRQSVDDIRVTIEAERQKNVEPALFETIHVHFHLKGALDSAKVERAVALSMEKYCSVAKTLEKTATITWEWSLEA